MLSKTVFTSLQDPNRRVSPAYDQKIDQAFIRRLHAHPTDHALIRSMFALGHSVKPNGIAECDETDKHVAFLAQARYDKPQAHPATRGFS